jgi:hypothetical protein
LLDSYHRSMQEEVVGHKPKGDVWEGLQSSFHADFISLLEKNDPESLAGYLCNMYRQPATHGLVQGALVHNELLSNEERRRNQAALCVDKLVCLAEALGCLPCESPEQGRLGVNIYLDVEELIDQIETAIEIDITQASTPGGLFGIDTSRGILEFRYFFAIYAAWRIRQLLRQRKDASVCEIGAGIGWTAGVAYNMGIRNYTIFDLPYVAVISGYHLIKYLPQGKVLLYGERAPDDEASIKLYPYWHLEKAESKCFNLTFNQDSFPEIAADTVNWYLDSIPKNTREFFLSINQEGQAHFDASGKEQLFVSGLLKGRKTYELISRFPYWLREGYTEELYRIVR